MDGIRPKKQIILFISEPSTTSWYGKYQMSHYLQDFSTIQTVVGLGISSTARNWFRHQKTRVFQTSPPRFATFSAGGRPCERCWKIAVASCWDDCGIRHCVLDSWLSFSVRFCCSQNRVTWLSFPEPVGFSGELLRGAEVIVGLITAVSFLPQPIVQILDLGYFLAQDHLLI